MLRFIVSGLVVGSMFSCSKSSDSDTASAGGITELQGTWVSGCIKPAGESTYTKNTNVISGATITQTQVHYTESTCTTNIYDSKIVGSMAAAGDATTPTGSKKYNYTLASVSQTPRNSAYVSAFNSQKTCEISDWAVNTERDVTGKTCGTIKLTAGTITYDVYKITTALATTTFVTGVTDGTNDGSTDAKRYIVLDTNAYTKQ